MGDYDCDCEEESAWLHLGQTHKRPVSQHMLYGVNVDRSRCTFIGHTSGPFWSTVSDSCFIVKSPFLRFFQWKFYSELTLIAHSLSVLRTFSIPAMGAFQPRLSPLPRYLRQKEKKLVSWANTFIAVYMNFSVFYIPAAVTANDWLLDLLIIKCLKYQTA